MSWHIIQIPDRLIRETRSSAVMWCFSLTVFTRYLEFGLNTASAINRHFGLHD